jgi:hypothetical protein
LSRGRWDEEFRSMKKSGRNSATVSKFSDREHARAKLAQAMVIEGAESSSEPERHRAGLYVEARKMTSPSR